MTILEPKLILPAVLAAATVAPILRATPTGDGPDEIDETGWRDDLRPELREHWDALEGKPAPEIAGLEEWLQTDARSWEDLKGKVVLLDLWATWCGPCVAGIPKLKKLHETHRDDGLVILGVHVPRGWEKMKDFAAERELPYACAADEDGSLTKALGVQFIPSYFVVGRDGEMRVAGANRDKLGEIVATLLGKEAEPSWPAVTQKELHAKDVRGKEAPELQVEEWLTDAPDREGKVLMIDFWATWCPPCRAAIPHVNELYEELGDDLVIVGVSDEEPQKVRSFMESTAMRYPQAIDTQGRMKKELGVQGIPNVFVISTDGVVRWQGVPAIGPDPLSKELLEQIIEADPGVRKRRAEEKKEAEEKAKKEKKKGEGARG